MVCLLYQFRWIEMVNRPLEIIGKVNKELITLSSWDLMDNRMISIQ